MASRSICSRAWRCKRSSLAAITEELRALTAWMLLAALAVGLAACGGPDEPASATDDVQAEVARAVEDSFAYFATEIRT